jgi:hypothetical protein
MIHSKADLPPHSKKIPLEKPPIQPVFGSEKITFWNCFDYAPKRAVFQSRIKKYLFLNWKMEKFKKII